MSRDGGGVITHPQMSILPHCSINPIDVYSIAGMGMSFLACHRSWEGLSAFSVLSGDYISIAFNGLPQSVTVILWINSIRCQNSLNWDGHQIVESPMLDDILVKSTDVYS